MARTKKWKAVLRAETEAMLDALKTGNKAQFRESGRMLKTLGDIADSIEESQENPVFDEEHSAKIGRLQPYIGQIVADWGHFGKGGFIGPGWDIELDLSDVTLELYNTEIFHDGKKRTLRSLGRALSEGRISIQRMDYVSNRYEVILSSANPSKTYILKATSAIVSDR